MTGELNRGSVVLVRFDPSQGREIRKTRPAVVVSNNAACLYDEVVQVVPLTGMVKRKLRPYEALVASPVSGVSKPSRAVTNQIRTISRQRIVGHLGQLTNTEAGALNQAIMIQLDLAQSIHRHDRSNVH